MSLFKFKIGDELQDKTPLDVTYDVIDRIDDNRGGFYVLQWIDPFVNNTPNHKAISRAHVEKHFELKTKMNNGSDKINIENEAVMAVIVNEEGKILAVSRKDDHNDFGLPGGKVEEIDKHPPDTPMLYNALKREVREETGLDILINIYTPQLVYARCGKNRMKYTYYADVKDLDKELKTDESHVVKWVDPAEILRGRFGDWNWEVLKSLKNMGLDLLNKNKRKT